MGWVCAIFIKINWIGNVSCPVETLKNRPIYIGDYQTLING